MIPSAGGVCPPSASFYLVRIIKERNKGGRGERGEGRVSRERERRLNNKIWISFASISFEKAINSARVTSSSSFLLGKLKR